MVVIVRVMFFFSTFFFFPFFFFFFSLSLGGSFQANAKHFLFIFTLNQVNVLAKKLVVLDIFSPFDSRKLLLVFSFLFFSGI